MPHGRAFETGNDALSSATDVPTAQPCKISLFGIRARTSAYAGPGFRTFAYILGSADAGAAFNEIRAFARLAPLARFLPFEQRLLSIVLRQRFVDVESP